MRAPNADLDIFQGPEKLVLSILSERGVTVESLGEGGRDGRYADDGAVRGTNRLR